jgi:hypothetical protein
MAISSLSEKDYYITIKLAAPVLTASFFINQKP